jgi:hypothetical protein
VKLLATILLLATMTVMACGGSNKSDTTGADTGAGASTGSAAATGSTGGATTGATAASGSTDVALISAADADRVAHAGLPTIDDLPGSNWLVVGQDDFGGGSTGDFAELIQGTPSCETLQNLAALESVFGGDSQDKEPIGHGQVELENQDPNALIPTSVEVEIEIKDSAAGSRAAFQIVKNLFESDQTSDCLIAVLNKQFAETGPAGMEITVKKGSATANAPQDGARMSFDVGIKFAGTELNMAMQMYFWPYRNAEVKAIFLGTSDTLTAGFVGDVLKTVDQKIAAAAGD